MKITLLTPALVAILGLALAGVPMTTQAQTSTNSASATSAPATVPKSTKFRGTITAIDATSVTIGNKEASIANAGKTRTLAITPKTTFKIGKTDATLADFAVGDKVSGSYTTDASGTMSANSLHKKSASAPAPAATTAAPATPAAN
ncbi:MAG TPA: hypothetical protein VGZ93_10410 [Candidatus Methylacidiphilales bacterium]|jgi:hypothetical protein|nr:hypothetical protein [Candidatus Methylacidiphilales bacterium]